MDLNLDIQIDPIRVLGEDPACDPYYTCANSAILYSDPGTSQEARIGSIVTCRINAAQAQADGVPLRRVFDDVYLPIPDVRDLLYGPDGHSFRRDVLLEYAPATSDLMIVAHVLLDPEWRGYGLGLLAVRKALDEFGRGCGLAVFEIFPPRTGTHDEYLVPELYLPPNATDESHRAGTAKLQRHFERLMFRRHGATPYHVLPMSQWAPTSQDLIRALTSTK